MLRVFLLISALIFGVVGVLDGVAHHNLIQAGIYLVCVLLTWLLFEIVQPKRATSVAEKGRTLSARSSMQLNMPEPVESVLENRMSDEAVGVSGFVLKVTSITDGGDELIESDLVSFEAVAGEPEKQVVCSFLESFSTSACNITYCEKAKKGTLTDLNFEYKVGQEIDSVKAEPFYS